MIAFGLVLTALLGWLLLPRRLGLGPVGGLAAGFLMGAFLLSVEMFFFGLAGISWRPAVLLLPLILGAGWKTFKSRPNGPSGFHWSDAVAIGAVLLALAVWLPYERLMPLTSRTWDTWAIWLFKSKAFFVDRGVDAYLSRAGEFTGQPGYPLLTPLYGTFLYRLAGAVDDHAAKLMTPVYWLSLAGVFHAVAARLATRTIAGVATAVLVLTPMLQRVGFELAGYADIPLAAYFVAAAGWLTLYWRDGDAADFVAAATAATAAAWTKNEGQLFLAAFVAAAALALVRSKAKPVLWAWLIAPPVVLLGVWSVVRSSAAVEAAGFTPGLDFEAGLFGTAFAALLGKALAPGSFALAFPAFLGGVALLGVYRASLGYWVAPALVAANMGGALLAYATGRNEIHWWLETSADRLLAQVAPLALLTVAAACGLWAEKAPAPAPAAPAAPAPKAEKKAKRKKR